MRRGRNKMENKPGMYICTVIIFIASMLVPKTIANVNDFSLSSDEVEQFYDNNLEIQDFFVNIADLENSDVHYVSDLSSSAMYMVSSALNAKEIPVFQYTPNYLEDKLKMWGDEKCPVFSAPHHDGDEGHAEDGGHGDDDGHKDDGHKDDGHEDDGHKDDGHKDDGHEDDGHEDDHDEKGMMYSNLTTIASKYPDSFAKPSLQYFGQFKQEQEIPKEVLFSRPDQLLSNGIYHKTVIIWVKDNKKVLDIFRETALFCNQFVDVGVYNPTNRFYFMVNDEATKDLVLNDPYVRKHRAVAVIKPIKSSKNKMVLYTHNFFHKTTLMNERTMPRFIWSPNNWIKNRDEIFTPLKDFNQHRFKVGALPWSHHVGGDKVDAPKDTPATYTNYWGYEIELLKSMAKLMNFEYDIYNVEDGKWGHVEADGKWSGKIAKVFVEDYDLIISDIFITYKRCKIFDATVAFDKDYMVFVAPNPQQNPKYLAIVQPLTPNVWLAVGCSLVVAAVVFVYTSKLEEKIIDLQLHAWSSVYQATWYVYGTLIGESITRDINSVGANATRALVATWIMYCLILSSSYSGNLKAFLTTPGYSQPIDTLKDVLDSGLTWGMVLYGEEEEEMMAASPDPVIQRIWQEKEVKPYSPTVAEVDSVLAGESIFIDWKSGLEPAIYAKYSTPGGDPLVHLASTPVFMPNFPGWAFHKFNPWRARFDELLQRHVEAGLVDEWKWRTWVRKKNDAIAKGDVIDYVEPPTISPLTLDDMQSAFLLLLMIMTLGLISFIIEFIKRK